jgi:rod shape-determining protein MreC
MNVPHSSAPLFTADAANTLRLVGYLALAIALMVADHNGQWLHRIRYAGSAVIEPIYRLAAVPADMARSTGDALIDRAQLQARNESLSRELLLAQAQLNRLLAVREQNRHLQQLLDVQQHLNLGVQLARVVNVDTDPFRHRVVVNAGVDQGVQVGEAVLDANGVVGQVIETLPDTSTVMLITDPTHALPVAVERTAMRSIAHGGGSLDTLKLPNIPISADLRVGDRLVTSGLGGQFPAGFPVGTVRAIRNDASGMFTLALATPSAALDRVDQVLILHRLPDPIGPPALAPVEGPPTASAGAP